MLMNRFKNTYNFTLPESTAKEVVEWFEIMENNNRLAEALVELVFESIRSNKTCNFLSGSPDNALELQNTRQGSQSDLFDNLYNWQDSKSAIFKDEAEVKKEKKKMLSV